MATIPINTLSPRKAPLRDKSIRAVVTLLWPYSSSTKQCALLLAEPDFRLRNHQGQVRVRFTGASARAVAKGKIGIGDEVELDLRGSSWVTERTNVATPGRSIDGELLFGSELGLHIVKKASGEEINDSIQVNESTPPPEEPRHNATPTRSSPKLLLQSMGHVDVVPIYSSPAFVRRARLSEEYGNLWGNFADVDHNLDAEESPRKKQRLGFGVPGKWRVRGRTPSPEKDHTSAGIIVDEEEADGDQSDVHLEQKTLGAVETAVNGIAAVWTDASEDMPPPPLRQLQMPDEPAFLAQQSTSQDQFGAKAGPYTPKLQPVPSSALPLPSPFPAEAKQLRIGAEASIVATTTGDDQGAVRPLGAIASDERSEDAARYAADTSAESNLLDTIEGVATQTFIQNLPPAPSFSGSIPSTVAPEIDSDVNDDYDDDNESDDERQYASSGRKADPDHEYDTEEDNELLTHGLQRDNDERQSRFEPDEIMHDDTDHEEEDGMEDIVTADDVEEAIKDMGEPLESDDSEGDHSGELEDSEGQGGEPTVLADDRPRTQLAVIEPSSDLAKTIEEKQSHETPAAEDKSSKSLVAAKVPASSTASDGLDKPSQVGDALSSTFGQENASKEKSMTVTPVKTVTHVFGFDGTAEQTASSMSTPQSERDRIMKKTYSSLFGFARSPSPEKPQHVRSPTPSLPSQGLSQMARDRFAAADLSIDETSIGERPVPARATAAETQSSPVISTVATSISVPEKQLVPAQATIADTQSQATSSASSTTDTPVMQMPVPARATVPDTQSELADSAPLGGTTASTTPQETLVKASHNAESLLESAAATEETGRSQAVEDVQDGSLLAAVHGSAPKIYADDRTDAVQVHRSSGVEERPGRGTQSDEVQGGNSPMVNEMHGQQEKTMRDDIGVQRASAISRGPPEQVRLLAEDSVPDNVPINQELGKAIAPDHIRSPPPPASAAPKPSQIQVIDLGGSSDEEDDNVAQTTSTPRHVPVVATPLPSSHPEGHGFAQTRANTEDEDDESARRQPPSYAGAFASHSHMAGRSHAGLENVTQVSQGSNLQSDMLDTTQTTIDGRSDVMTPRMDEYEHIVPHGSQDESMGVFRGQANFFDDQMHGQEFEGNARMPQLPPLSQRTGPVDLAAEYHPNISFQSATSIATDNSAYEPPEIAVADSIQPASSVGRSVGHDNASGIAATSMDHANTAMQEQSLLDATKESEDVQMLDDSRSSSFLGEQQSQYTQQQPAGVLGASFERQPAAVTETDAVVTETGSDSEAYPNAEGSFVLVSQEESKQRLRSAVAQEQVSLRSLPATEQLLHSDLPFNSEKSPRKTESQSFETQVPYYSVQSGLPQTPELIQGAPLTQQDVEIDDQGLTETSQPSQSGRVNSASPRRTRASQKQQWQESQHSVESQPFETQIPLATPQKRTPVRRSSRKSQADAQASKKEADLGATSVSVKQVTRHSSIDRPVTPPQPRLRKSPEDTMDAKQHPSPSKKKSVRRSPRKSQVQPRSLERLVEGAGNGQSFTDTEMDELAADHHLLSEASQTSSKRSTRHSQINVEASHGVGERDDDNMTDILFEAATPAAAKQVKVGVESSFPDTEVGPDSNRTSTKHAGRKSLAARLNEVPAAISKYFSPRRSSRREVEAKEKEQAATEEDSPKRNPKKSIGLQTKMSYFTPLANLSEKLNPASQSHGDNTVDILAVVTDQSSKPERAKSGPRDYFTIFKVTDQSLGIDSATSVEIFKHWRAFLPDTLVGDVILLRAFNVKSKKRHPFLLSTDDSAWCVWRYAEHAADENLAVQGSPVRTRHQRERAGSFSAVREEVKGKPIELGEEERQRAAELREWWLESKDASVVTEDNSATVAQESVERVGRKTRSQNF